MLVGAPLYDHKDDIQTLLINQRAHQCKRTDQTPRANEMIFQKITEDKHHEREAGC